MILCSVRTGGPYLRKGQRSTHLIELYQNKRRRITLNASLPGTPTAGLTVPSKAWRETSSHSWAATSSSARASMLNSHPEVKTTKYKYMAMKQK